MEWKVENFLFSKKKKSIDSSGKVKPQLEKVKEKCLFFCFVSYSK